jgi:hypothetical protein
VEEVARVAAARGLSTWEALAVVEQEGLLPGRATQPLRRFREMIAGLREDAARLGVKGLLTRTLEVTGYAAALAQEPTHESQDRLENLAEPCPRPRTTRPGTGAPAWPASRSGLPAHRRRSGEGGSPVLLMTFHAAKGLELGPCPGRPREAWCRTPAARAIPSPWRRAAPGLRRHDPGHGRAAPDLGRASRLGQPVAEPAASWWNPRDRLETADAAYEAPIRGAGGHLRRPRTGLPAREPAPPLPGAPPTDAAGVKVRHPLVARCCAAGAETT